MQSVLIDAPSLSPRLRWLREHDLVVRKADLHCMAGAGALPVMCSNRAHTNFGMGSDERDAELAYAARYGLKHWAVAEWNAAMAEGMCLD